MVFDIGSDRIGKSYDIRIISFQNEFAFFPNKFYYVYGSDHLSGTVHFVEIGDNTFFVWYRNI